jgi:RimJ/RimL family protein N-acetyltransferase
MKDDRGNTEEPGFIAGNHLILRPASMDDRRVIYEWLALSSATPSMMGAPLFPENPPPSWEEFVDDYTDNYFDGSEPGRGRLFVIEADGNPVGAISYSTGGVRDACFELDIWMSREEECGKGYGPDALDTLCRYLESVFGPKDMVIRPSARNRRAVRAYRKAGFVPLAPGEDGEYGPGEYRDTITLVRLPNPTTSA